MTFDPEEDAMFEQLAFRLSRGSPALLLPMLALLSCAALLLGFI